MVLAWRRKQLALFELDPRMVDSAKAFYATNPVAFINHWCDTYDPRNAGTGNPTHMPFILFERQAEFVQFLFECLRDDANGLTEKCRDMGATWVCVAFSVWLWLFWPGVAVGWGSRKKELVDQLGDPKSIFEKIRELIRRLPPVFLPKGFTETDHLLYMRVVNPENGSTIIGETGDNIGRGGRTRIYFKDESAHYVHAEAIEAALGDNTNVQIDISSVNGLGNVFHRKREGGVDWTPGGKFEPGYTRVFVFDYSDHPLKTKAWYDKRRATAEREGLLHIFAQEVERNYSASITGTIIPAEHVLAAIDAHIKLGLEDTGEWAAALDVADEGIDRNALVKRQGIVLRHAEEWAARDPGVSARKAIDGCTGHGAIEMQYDCIGIGAAVKAEINRLADDNLIPVGMTFVPWNAAAAVLYPKERVNPKDKESPTNETVLKNLKAQGWWELRGRFFRTFKAVTEGEKYDPDTLISLDSTLPLIRQIQRELSQAVFIKGTQLKLVVDKSPDGTRSPNIADAIVELYWPATPPQRQVKVW